MKFRVARHTNNSEAITKFYTEILGFEILGDFKNHDSYDGVFIGKQNADWHLEFTQSNDKAVHQFDEDDLLVFYPETLSEYNEILKKFHDNNITKLKAKNPYWEINGLTYADPDGFRIVISNLKAIRILHS